MNIKIWIGILGAMAILNLIADIWFRISISGATGAPWYVWGAVIGTVALGLLALTAQYFIKKSQQRG